MMTFSRSWSQQHILVWAVTEPPPVLPNCCYPEFCGRWSSSRTGIDLLNVRAAWYMNVLPIQIQKTSVVIPNLFLLSISKSHRPGPSQEAAHKTNMLYYVIQLNFIHSWSVLVHHKVFHNHICNFIKNQWIMWYRIIIKP